MSDNASAQSSNEQSDYAALLTERELYNIPKSFALEILEEVAYEAADEDETETQAILSRAAVHRDQYLLACQSMLTRHLDGIMQDTLHKAAQDFVKNIQEARNYERRPTPTYPRLRHKPTLRN